MKKFYLPVYYCFMSLLFTLQSIVYINDVGDQISFARLSRRYGFFEFAIHRYEVWSSRLLIESVTMFMSAHYLIFDITMLIAVAAFFYCFNGIFLKDDKYWGLRFIIPALFLLVFPSIFFTSAGLIATVTNYLFPMIAFVIAWYCLEQKKIKWLLTSFPFMIFACMQEQFTIFALIIFAFLLLKTWLIHKQINAYYLSAVVIAFVGTISALVAPGSAHRTMIESKTWYPGFDKLSLVVKVAKGYMETNRVLFVTSELTIIYLLLIAALVLALLKRRYVSSVMSGAVLYTILTNRLGSTSLLTAVQRVNDFQSQQPITKFSFKANLYPLSLYTILLAVIAISVFLIFENRWQAGTAIVVLAVGYVARMTVSLSPTIYASGLRTYTPLIFSGLIIMMMICCEFIDTISLQRK
ncbi:hypothetical protein [Streptococcus tangpeifui]|uniref:hypothetical protein n=1 Tax=Streptococcus tangpeifui TaxID=2709400 RepID=UPI0013EDB349|nr:hypothetical protein [Streptococcus sp. ZJ373]